MKIFLILYFIFILILNAKNIDIPSPQDREMERTYRVAVSKIEFKKNVNRLYNINDLINIQKLMNQTDWNSIKKLEECLNNEEKKQFNRLFKGLFSFKLDEALYAIGETMFDEIKGNTCKEQNKLTENATKYKKIFLQLQIPEIRKLKNAKLNIN